MTLLQNVAGKNSISHLFFSQMSMYLSLSTSSQRHNSQRCAFVNQTRSTYPRMYKTKLYLEDGSTITVRSSIPRKFITLPIDMTKLNENEQRKLWLSRKSKIQAVDAVETGDDFDSSKYSEFWK